jgi:hypothetical protein
MMVKINGPLQIDNLRHYPAETVERLRSLLATGVLAIPDSRRKNFYDLEDGDRMFYIHISPTGTVLLLASWRKENAHRVPPREAARAEAMGCCG